MRHRWIIAVACVAALLSCVPLMKVVRVSFFPENDEAKFELTMQTPEGTSRESTGLAAERVAADIRRLDGVLRTVVTIGDSSTESSNQASIFVQLSDPDQRSESADDIQARARKEILSRLPAGTRVTPSEDGPGNVVEYIISGPDIDRLGEFAQKAVELMKKEPGAVDVYTSYIRGKPELQVIVDRDKAADLGVRVADVADTLRLLVGGVDVSTFATQGEQFDIRLRADAEFRKDVESLATVTVPSTIHGTVPLRDVVTARESVGLSSIDRDSRQRQVSVTAHADQGYGQNQIQASMNKVMKQLNMPAEYKAYPSGFTQEANRVARSFLIAFALSFIFMYLVLAAQFESWLHPLTIMTALPLTIPFALLSILMFNGSLNIFSALGLFVLFGIVKKNSILQIDHINHLRAEGRPRLQAILEGNRDRLRPILMTTIAFVAGVLPLAFSNGIGAGQSQAIAHVIVGGQTLSLLLTLLAIPVIYSWFDDLTEWFKRRFKRGEQVDRGEAEIQ